jgi:hypothetical protein
VTGHGRQVAKIPHNIKLHVSDRPIIGLMSMRKICFGTLARNPGKSSRQIPRITFQMEANVVDIGRKSADNL